jgi:hypothetical protein
MYNWIRCLGGFPSKPSQPAGCVGIGLAQAILIRQSLCCRRLRTLQ